MVGYVLQPITIQHAVIYTLPPSRQVYRASHNHPQFSWYAECLAGSEQRSGLSVTVNNSPLNGNIVIGDAINGRSAATNILSLFYCDDHGNLRRTKVISACSNTSYPCWSVRRRTTGNTQSASATALVRHKCITHATACGRQEAGCADDTSFARSQFQLQ